MDTASSVRRVKLSYDPRKLRPLVRCAAYLASILFCYLSLWADSEALDGYLKVRSSMKATSNATIDISNLKGPLLYSFGLTIVVLIISHIVIISEISILGRFKSKAELTAWRIVGVFTSVAQLLNALVLTSVAATQCAYLTGVPAAESLQVETLQDVSTAPLCYRQSPMVIVAVFFAWLTWIAITLDGIPLFAGLTAKERAYRGNISVEEARFEDQQAGTALSVSPKACTEPDLPIYPPFPAGQMRAGMGPAASVAEKTGLY